MFDPDLQRKEKTGDVKIFVNEFIVPKHEICENEFFFYSKKSFEEFHKGYFGTKTKVKNITHGPLQISCIDIVTPNSFPQKLAYVFSVLVLSLVLNLFSLKRLLHLGFNSGDFLCP